MRAIEFAHELRAKGEDGEPISVKVSANDTTVSCTTADGVEMWDKLSPKDRDDIEEKIFQEEAFFAYEEAWEKSLRLKQTHPANEAFGGGSWK